MLEVIDKGRSTDAHPVPLLFVHGGLHAAWCWDEHFLDYFAERGFRAIAPSWRGHGASTSSKPLSKCSISDYVDDVHSVAAGLDQAPVLIAHSVGGFVAQKYLERHAAPAAVLMGSTPPSGILRSSMRIWRRHPWTAMRANMVGRSHEIFNTPAGAREHFYSPYTPDEVVQAGAARIEPESMRAVFIDQVFSLPKVDRITTPLLVLGAEEDGMISQDEVRATARAYGTEAVLFPKMGHNMMVEPGWRDVAEYINEWLVQRHL
ncbi:alpha/beta fold hydrolase [Mycolicibacterium sp. P9-64]|uniref:alpha/beta hydrolase n=1 Tax=Mycolicibacterium sp. P9-64 TaxID=2024612 RepID=UPI0011EF81A7|nr:alpha/beta fold hydrolase [Mycolicibacterium sp. P9-64]KAA0079055.1 alpha/beta fold hydrolase [Mycolicibacterium sp. P9-64]